MGRWPVQGDPHLPSQLSKPCPQMYPPNPPYDSPSNVLGIFNPPLPHPNIFPRGETCLSLLNTDWKPAVTMKQVLLGLQALLDEPNPKSPANEVAYLLFRYMSLNHFLEPS